MRDGRWRRRGRHLDRAGFLRLVRMDLGSRWYLRFVLDGDCVIGVAQIRRRDLNLMLFRGDAGVARHLGGTPSAPDA